jgi:hypothetical protein
LKSLMVLPAKVAWSAASTASSGICIHSIVLKNTR